MTRFHPKMFLLKIGEKDEGKKKKKKDPSGNICIL